MAGRSAFRRSRAERLPQRAAMHVAIAALSGTYGYERTMQRAFCSGVRTCANPARPA